MTGQPVNKLLSARAVRHGDCCDTNVYAAILFKDQRGTALHRLQDKRVRSFHGSGAPIWCLLFPLIEKVLVGPDFPGLEEAPAFLHPKVTQGTCRTHFHPIPKSKSSLVPWLALRRSRRAARSKEV